MGHQSENSVVRRWQTNFDARMDWAFDAYGRLVASLSSDVRSSMASAHPEAYVVVFGRTQVGKTTLLLELMGVNAPSVDRVSTVLRGGRVKGQSATATAMEYGRSVDESWSLQVPNQPPERFAEDSQVCSALGALRHRMEAQQLNLDGPVRLDIPCDCFVPVDEGHARVRMLDLPGDQASNPVEQQHVEQIAERFVAGADLILLVGKMDDLSFLKPGGLLLPGIEDWQIVPDRFRIITTYSFTAGSVQAAVRKHGLRIEQIRSRLIDQLETFGPLSLEARRADLFFPLEFGQSIERAAHHDPDLVSQIKPLVDELKAELAHQINSSTTPMARLRTALSSHLTVAKVKAQRLAVMAKEAERLNDCLASARADLEVAQRAELANVKSYERFNFRQDQIVRHNPKARISAICALDEAELLSAVAGSAKSVKCLQYCLDEFRSWMRESYLALDTSCDSASADLAWFWRGIRLPLEDDLHEVRRLLDEHLGAIESHLNQYWIDRYVIDRTFQRDVVSVQEAIKEAANACRALAKRRWLSAVERQIKAHTRKWEESLNEVLLDKKLLRDLRAKVESESDAVTHFDRQCRDFESRMTGDLERCRAFTEILDECYERQLVTMIDRMRCVNDPSYALVELISCVQLIETRSHLLTTASPQHTH